MNDEFLTQIKSLHSGRMKHCGGALYKREKKLFLEFVTDVAPAAGLEEQIEKIALKYLPDGYTPKVVVKKVVTQPEFVAASVISYLGDKHVSCATQIKKSQVYTELNGENATLKINCEHSVYQYFQSRQVPRELEEYLGTQYVESFSVTAVDFGERPIDKSLFEVKLTEREMRVPIRRTLRVDSVERLFDDDETAVATYIADTQDMLGEVYLAGIVSAVSERTTKTNKPFFMIDFGDRTGSVTGAIFPTKDKIPKIKKLQAGSEIIVRAEFSTYNGYRNLRISSINLCCFPKNFVPTEKPKRPVPAEYSVVFPQPLVLEDQENFLEDDTPPECFEGRTFVVFDLETTGTGTEDKITEIGAVRLENGKFTEYFSTLVNPEQHISAQIEELTGINDEMVKDAPLFDDVCADFYKFCDGATLVAHNAAFDTTFVRRQAKPIDYVFDHPVMDTLALGREVFPRMGNHKLNTLCDRFGIVFNHHRAYSDALATAKLFIELIRIKKDFPF